MNHAHQHKRCPGCIALIPARWTCCDACAGKMRERAVAAAKPQDELRSLERQLRRDTYVWMRADERGLVDMHANKPVIGVDPGHGEQSVLVARQKDGSVVELKAEPLEGPTFYYRGGEADFSLKRAEGGGFTVVFPEAPKPTRLCCECFAETPIERITASATSEYACCFDCEDNGAWESVQARQVDKAAAAAGVAEAVVSRKEAREWVARRYWVSKATHPGPARPPEELESQAREAHRTMRLGEAAELQQAALRREEMQRRKQAAVDGLREYIRRGRYAL